MEIETAAKKIMNEEAVNAYPDECCGFMFGQEDGSGYRTVRLAMPVINASVENRKRRFEVSPKDYISAEKYALDNQLLLLGVYHSHPDHPAEPSEHDRIAAQPWFSYVILSVLKGVVNNTRSWLLNDESHFEEEQLN